MTQPKEPENKSFSDFIRTSSGEEREKVFKDVMKEATEDQIGYLETLEPWEEEVKTLCFNLDTSNSESELLEKKLIDLIRRTREEARSARDEEWKEAIEEIIENAAPYDGAKWHNDIKVSQLQKLRSKMEEGTK